MRNARRCFARTQDQSVRAKRNPLFLGIALVMGVWIVGSAEGLAKDPDVVVFYREGCHDCARMDEVLKPLEQEHPDLVVLRLEETANLDLLWALSSKYGILPTAFPVIFVGAKAFAGVGREKEWQLRTAVEACLESTCTSPLALLAESKFPWKLVLLAVLAAVVLLVVAL
ncbi:MAG: thioredoxin family protein [Thermotogota bacterium]